MKWLRSRKDLASAKREEEAGAFSPSPSDWLSMDHGLAILRRWVPATEYVLSGVPRANLEVIAVGCFYDLRHGPYKWGIGAAEKKIIAKAWNSRSLREGDMLGQPGDGHASATTHANQYSSAGVLKSGWRSLGILYVYIYMEGCFLVPGFLTCIFVFVHSHMCI